VIAAVAQGPDALAGESADLLYHWLVLLAASGVSLDAVAEKLAAREGTSGWPRRLRGSINCSPPDRFNSCRGEGVGALFPGSPDERRVHRRSRQSSPARPVRDDNRF
jgi:hypothetical protein